MRAGRPALYQVPLRDKRRGQSEAVARSRSLPHAQGRRARIVLMVAEGHSNKAIAERLRVSSVTVTKWRKRFIEGGLEGLYDLLSTGRPRTYDDEAVVRMDAAGVLG